MEFKGSQAILTTAEQAATGLPSPVEVQDICITTVLDRLKVRYDDCLQRQAHDSDGVAGEQLMINMDLAKLATDRAIAHKMMEQLFDVLTVGAQNSLFRD